MKQGQIIAELDSTDALNQIKQANISLNDSKIKLAQDLEPAEQKDVLSARATVDKWQSDIELAKTTLENLKIEINNKLADLQNQIGTKQSDIISKTNSLTLAQSQMEVLIKQEGKNVSDTSVSTNKTVSTAYSDGRKYLIDAKKYLVQIDQIFGISSENKSLNDGFENYLSAKDITLKNQVETSWNQAIQLLDQSTKSYELLNATTATSEEIQTVLTQIQSLYNGLIIAGKNSSDAVNASIASSSYPQSQIDGQYSSMLQVVSGAQGSFTQIESTLANLKTVSDPALQKLQSDNNISKQQSAINDAKTALNTAKNDLVSLQNNLDLTTANYKNQIKQQEFSIQNLINSLATNKANLSLIQQGTKKEQIALDKSAIAKQEISLEQAKKSLDKYRIEAPFDGIVRQIDFLVGDNIVSDDTKYVYIDNPNLLEITAQLDQIEVAKLKIWQKTSIVFDSFPDVTFSGSVSEINSTPIQSSGVTSYEIKITMDKGKHSIFSGMTAKMTIIVDERKNVLVAPTSFIQKKKDMQYVTLQDGTQAKIILWLESPTKAEIKEWVEEWEIITRTITISGSGSQSKSLLNIGWGGGWNRAASGGGGGDIPH